MKKINSTRDIKVNSILRIHKGGYGYSKITVCDVNDYFLAALADRDLIENVVEGDICESYLWVENEASYEFTLEVLGMFGRDLSFIFFKHTADIVWSRSRKCLKADVQIPLKFFPLEVGNPRKNFNSKEITILRGTIVELSDREALLQFNGDMKESTFLRGHFSVDTISVDIVGRIVLSKMQDGERYYQIEFSGMSDRERDKILDYVFSVYKE
jgi:c-di-GMP-binding flagellar brake protein YcgR